MLFDCQKNSSVWYISIKEYPNNWATLLGLFSSWVPSTSTYVGFFLLCPPMCISREENRASIWKSCYEFCISNVPCPFILGSRRMYLCDWAWLQSHWCTDVACSDPSHTQGVSFSTFWCNQVDWVKSFIRSVQEPSSPPEDTTGIPYTFLLFSALFVHGVAMYISLFMILFWHLFKSV